MDRRRRVIIEGVAEIDCGMFPIERTTGESVRVEVGGFDTAGVGCRRLALIVLAVGVGTAKTRVVARF